MPLRLNLPEKGLLLVCVPLVFELIFVGVLTLLLQQAEIEIKTESRATMVLSTANQFVTLFHDAASKLVEYGLTKNEAMLRQYEEIINQYPERCAALREIVKDNPKELQLIDEMEESCNQGVELLNMHRDQLVGGGRLEALRHFRADRTQVKELIDRLVARTKALAAEERSYALKASPEGKAAARLRVQQFIFLGVGVNIILALSLALYFMQNVVRRLGTLTENTARLARGAPLNPRLSGEDEIANLDGVFHEMAAALTEAAAKEREMTETARASEARVQSVIDSMPVGLVIASSEGVIESANPRMEQIFGIAAQELVGKNLIELFPTGAFKSFSDLAGQHKERAVGGTAEWQASRDGTSFPVELELNDFSTRDGDRILAIIEDVSERHEVEKLKKEFVAMVSHELRTPLTSIRGSLGLLAAGKLGDLSEKAQRAVTIAERNTVRLSALINDILDLEKLESGKMEMHFEAVKVAYVIERSLESVRAFADSNEVVLQVEQGGSTALLNADGDRLVQVVVNLLSNAVKFSPRGSAVTVSVDVTPGWVTIKVKDRGRGIPATHKDLIFERFQQVEQSDAKKKGGSGLGLAICKAIIEQHGGRIGVESQEGKGSQFWFRVPSKQQAA